MSHKYYGFNKQSEDNHYILPFLSTKTRRLRFLNNEFVAYGDKNEFIIHKNPGLTILRLNDNQINRGLANTVNTNQMMTEFLNELLNHSAATTFNQFTKTSQIKIKEVKVSAKSAIQIKLATI